MAAWTPPICIPTLERGNEEYCSIMAVMKEMTEITVKHAGGKYPVFVGAGAVHKADAFFGRPGVAAIVSDKKVWKKWENSLVLLQYASQAETVITGEKHKNLRTVEKIIDKLAELKMHRDGTVIAFGGGVVGDIAGFAAATYMRGVRLIQIPTTLLAMVDAAVGGKTGVNHKSGKNLIGAFHQPTAVFCDTDFLATLSEREYRAGLAEVVKYALLGDADFFKWLEKNAKELLDYKKPGNAAIQEAIVRSVKMKAQIVEADEREMGTKRALLNLGHTFAHALENAAGYGEWLHGEAVAAGLVAAAKLSAKVGKFPAADTEKIIQLLKTFGFRVSFSGIDPDKILSAMRMDKKFRAGAEYFILLESIGKAYYRSMRGYPEIREVLEEMQ